MLLKSRDSLKPCAGWSSAQIPQGCYAVVFVRASCVKKAWRHRSNKISCESLRKQSAMLFATPGQPSSASGCDGIHQILCSKSAITVPASLADSQAAKDSDWGICGRGQKTSAPSSTSAAHPRSAAVSSFVYRSFHEPVGGFIAVSSIRNELAQRRGNGALPAT